jgi:hypothetical protein
VRDRGAPVLDLLADPEALARLATGVAEVAVVEHERRHARPREPLGERGRGGRDGSG